MSAPSVITQTSDRSHYLPNFTNEVACFAGYFEKGPIDTPIFITNVIDFKFIFGRGVDLHHNDWYQVYNYLQYASGIWVTRTSGAQFQNASNEDTIFINNKNEFKDQKDSLSTYGLKFIAQTPGEWGNLLSVAVISYDQWDNNEEIFNGIFPKNVFTYFEPGYVGVCVFRKDKLVERFYKTDETFDEINDESKYIYTKFKESNETYISRLDCNDDDYWFIIDLNRGSETTRLYTLANEMDLETGLSEFFPDELDLNRNLLDYFPEELDLNLNLSSYNNDLDLNRNLGLEIGDDIDLNRNLLYFFPDELDLSLNLFTSGDDLDLNRNLDLEIGDDIDLNLTLLDYFPKELDLNSKLITNDDLNLSTNNNKNDLDLNRNLGLEIGDDIDLNYNLNLTNSNDLDLLEDLSSQLPDDLDLNQDLEPIIPNELDFNQDLEVYFANDLDLNKILDLNFSETLTSPVTIAEGLKLNFSNDLNRSYGSLIKRYVTLVDCNAVEKVTIYNLNISVNLPFLNDLNLDSTTEANKDYYTYYGSNIIKLSGGESSFPTDMDISEGYNLFESKESYDIDIVIGNDKNNNAAVNLVEKRRDSIAFIGIPTAFVTFLKLHMGEDNPQETAYTQSGLIVTIKETTIPYKITDEILQEFNNYIASIPQSQFVHFTMNVKEQYDGFTGKNKLVNIAGDTAGLKSKASLVTPWTASAGLERGQIKNIKSLYFNLSDKDNYYKQGLNYIENNILMTQKTYYTKQSSFNRVNVRSVFNHVEKETEKLLRYYIFEENTYRIRGAIASTVRKYLEDVKANQGIDAGRVHVHGKGNEILVDVFIKPKYVAEYIQLRMTSIGAETISKYLSNTLA